MRLLKIQNGGCRIVEYLGSDIPPYAILSHTWGPDVGEVTFEDMVNGTANSKDGNSKIVFCRERAVKDGLHYLWVDTCCIDKSSSAEIQEAVNSMFQWFQMRVDVMYTYPISRWFTRGWTLPELLAPQKVEFFSVEGHWLGNKQSLIQEIQYITGIPLSALNGTPLSKFSIEERISWAETRQTTLEEDSVYCMLGIFGLSMLLNYGEGKHNAFSRLKMKIEAAGPWSEETEFLLFPLDEIGESEEREEDDVDGRSPDTFICDIPVTDELMKNTDEVPDSNSDVRSELASIFSAEEWSNSSTSSASLNSVQTVGIREISRVLLNQEILKPLYRMAVLKVERHKARVHIRGFLREYGKNLLKEALNAGLQAQAAKFVQETAGRIADEISWSITRSDQEHLTLDTEVMKKDLETWLSSLPPQRADVEEKQDAFSQVFEDESDDEFENDLLFPSIEKVKGFLLDSEAFKVYVAAMRTWLKIDENHKRDDNNNEKVDEKVDEKVVGNIPRNTCTEVTPKQGFSKAGTSARGQEQTEHCGRREAEIDIHSQQDNTRELKLGFGHSRAHESIGDLLYGLLNFWGTSFFLSDIVELFVPSIRPGHKRLRWRCSCNTILWGDFLVDDDHDLDQLKRELVCWNVLPIHKLPSDTLASEPIANSTAEIPGTIEPGSTHAREPLQELEAAGLATSNSQNSTTVASSSSGATHVVEINFAPKYFEVCTNVGNYTVDHQELDISRVVSDNELFEMILDKYNSSRGLGLRRIFLRPKDVHFVMFSLNRYAQYGAGIHKKPDEFPPQTELDEKRYHYLCPKIRMPANVFLHYLHRARSNIWGEHAEDIWLRRLPKKLNEGVKFEMERANLNQQCDQNATTDQDLAFGWGIHIIDGPNHAVLGLLLTIGIGLAFVISGMVVGFAKTQEQGFGVGNFLLAIIASMMASIYFQLQDQ